MNNLLFSVFRCVYLTIYTGAYLKMCLIGIYTNEHKDKNLLFTEKLIGLLQKQGISYCLDENLSARFPGAGIMEDLHPDIITVLGGDGTMLSAVRKYARTGAKFFGINMGRVGFLLDSEMNIAETALKAIIDGKFITEDRMILCASVVSGETGRVKYEQYALNEIVVSQKSIQRMASLELSVNNGLVNIINCDGIIIATPTGSTGYSLSAGGPIVTPDLDVMLITPVCPHTLTSFNMVISGKDTVMLKPTDSTKLAAMTADGQKSFDIAEGDAVIVRAADFKAQFIRYSNKNFFTVLKEKLADWNDNRG